MSRKLQNYEEWQTSEGREELGTQILLTYAMLRRLNREAIHKAFELARGAFVNVCLDKGRKPSTIMLTCEDIKDIDAKKLTLMIEADLAITPERFIGVVYAQARDFYNQVELWETKSLWQYIKHCWNRRV